MALLLSAALGSCRPGESGAGRDLLQDFDSAELRSDSLDLPFLLERHALERRAWREAVGTPEAPIVWNGKPSAGIRLPLASATASDLRLRLRRHAGASARLPLTVTLNGRLLGTVELLGAGGEYQLAVPASAIVPGASLLTLAATSRREKGRLFALSGFEMRPSNAVGALVVLRREKNGILLPPGSSIGFFLEQERDGEIAAEVEAVGAAPGRARLCLDTDSGRQELADATLSASLRRIRVQPAMADGAFARLEIANVGPVALRLRGLRLAPRRVDAAAAGAALAQRPNVVIFLTDTLRADHLGAYGHPKPTSPRFDAFAREGIVFEDAWAQSPWTKPSVASIFTGLTPGSHGVVEFNRALARDATTLAQAFLAAGFRTAAFSGNPIVNARSRYNIGFKTWNSGGEKRLPPAERLVADALAWIDSGRGPFLLYVHTFEPHWLYQPREEHWAPFRPAGYKATETMAAARDRSSRSPEAREWVRSAYEGEIHQNDASFGALLDGLRQRQLLDASLVLFTADHGDEIQDHGGVGHASTLYQELLHIPLAVRLPGAQRAGTRDREPVQQIDLLPSLLRLANLPPIPGVEGRDLSSRVLLGRRDERPPELFSELRLVVRDKAAARIGPLKLVVNEDLDRNPRAKMRFELFDLATDPAETTNIESERPVTVRYLASRIEALRHAQAQRSRPDPSNELQLSPEERGELRALGYVQ